MDNLGSFFPESEKKDYVKRNFKPGSILYLYCPFTTPPKEKNTILLSTGDSALLFLINSRIHPYIAQRPHLANCQVLIKSADYSFLDHDSFIDCAQVFDDLTEDEIIEQLILDTSRVRGALTPSSVSAVHQAVKQAITIAPIHVRRISKSL